VLDIYNESDAFLAVFCTIIVTFYFLYDVNCADIFAVPNLAVLLEMVVWWRNCKHCEMDDVKTGRSMTMWKVVVDRLIIIIIIIIQKFIMHIVKH